MQKKGTLFLIPTPIDDEKTLPKETFDLIHHAYTNESGHSIFVVEDIRPGRRRWIHFGFNREWVDRLVEYNEHTRAEQKAILIEHLNRGQNVYLMSDCGLPAFCDPGVELVDACHKNGIRVTASAYYNSVTLALALSGYDHQQFLFMGFPSREEEKRKHELNSLKSLDKTAIIMDAPYRLKKLLEEIKLARGDRELFLALDLNKKDELLLRLRPSQILEQLSEFKREFVIVVSR